MISSESIVLDDPWIVPFDSEVDSLGDAMPFSPFEVAYQAVQSFSDSNSTNPDLVNEINGKSLSISTSESTNFSEIVHTYEQIRELLSVDTLPWEDLHHRFSFLPEIDNFENDFSSIFTTDYVKETQNPLQHPDSELNLGNISRTVPIDISVKPGIIENIHIGASCTDDEIQPYKALFQ